MVWKHEETGEYDGLMTLILRRSYSFVREVKLIIVIDDLPRTSVLKRCGVIVPVNFYVGSSLTRSERTLSHRCPLEWF